MSVPTDPVWDATDRYLEQLGPLDDALHQALADAAAAGLPAIQVSAAQGRFLQLLARLQGARRVLEVGTLGGFSTIWLARGLNGPDAHLTTLEISPVHAEVARRNLARAGLADVVQVRVGPALDSLANLHSEGVEPFDLVFIDADKPSNTAYLQWAVRLGRPGTLVVVDNVVRGGTIADPSVVSPDVAGSRAVIEAVTAHPRLEGAALQTVGSKGYDGFLLARVLA